MKQDLSEYVNFALQAEGVRSTYEIPDAIALIPEDYFPDDGFYVDGDGNIKSDDEDITPLFSIPLSDMAKLVREVKGNEFGVAIYCEDDFSQSISVYIPAFEIGGINGITGDKIYQKGVWDGEKIYFVNSSKTVITPKASPMGDLNANEELDVYIHIEKPCRGEITIELNFDWTEAEIDTSGNDLSDTYPISNELGNFLGDDVFFNKVLGYIYVDGIQGSGAVMTLETDDDVIVPATLLTSQPRPVFPASGEPFSEELPEHSLGTEGIDFAVILNNSDSSSPTTNLHYQIDINTWTIYKANVADSDINITADLVVLLPLELRIETMSAYSNEYVKLDFGDAFDFSGDEDNDLFGRTGDDDGLFKYLSEVTIILKNLKINLFDRDKLAIYVSNYDGTEIDLLDFGDAEPSLVIPDTIINPDPFIPFSPRFEVLLKKDDGKNYGTFSIKRQQPGQQAEFDFDLAVAAKTRIEIEL